tara:strand:+ start:20 stop:343 length:324 start_codon:yes stop_codon:yes gene_type:complete
MSRKMRVKKGDQVVVRVGKDKGRSGEILRVLKKKDRVIVQGVNMVKRHQRPTQTSPGGISESEAAIHVSNIGVADPKTNSPTRVGYRFLDSGQKIRFAKASGEAVDK